MNHKYARQLLRGAVDPIREDGAALNRLATKLGYAHRFALLDAADVDGYLWTRHYDAIMKHLAPSSTPPMPREHLTITSPSGSFRIEVARGEQIGVGYDLDGRLTVESLPRRA